MKYHISSSLFVLFCIVLCACNSSSVEKDGIIQPAFDLIERQIGERNWKLRNVSAVQPCPV